MDLNAGQLTRRIYSGLMQWTNGAYEESWDIRWHDFVRNADIRRITIQHHFYPSLSPVVSVFGHLA